MCGCIQDTLSPTKNPTKDPTKNPTNPTKSPTKDPTKDPTKNPTQNPTTNPTCLAVIRLYSGNSATGSIGGTPNDADQIATTQMGLNYPSQAPSCIKIIAMVSFSNRRLVDIPTWAQFSPLSPVKIKDTSTIICTTWQACVAS